LLGAWSLFRTSHLAAAVNQTNPDSVVVALIAPDSVAAGAPIRFTLRVENRAARAVDLYLRGRTLTFDVEVRDDGGAVVWRRLELEVIPAILQLRPMAPGERLEERFTWDQRTVRGPLPPGRYTARAMLLVEGPPWPTAPLHFTVVAR
jgi:hypothetical protein